MSLLGNLLRSLFGPRPAPPRPVPVPTPPPASGSDSSALAAAINRARVAHGLPSMAPDPRLDAVALVWAAGMAVADVLAHGGPGDADRRIRRALPGVPVAATGEVVAEGRATAEEITRDWLNSPSHRPIILGAYGLVGCGVARDSVGVAYWCASLARLGG